MPEAPVDEDGDPGGDEGKVGAASSAWKWPVHSEAKTHPVHGRSDGHLARCVATERALHATADSFG
jgi:hypothetical protein